MLVENFLDKGKIFACEKIPCGKMIGLSLLKMKSIKQMLVLKPLRYLFLNQEQKNYLDFFCGRQNQYYFCFGKNYNQSKPVEQLSSLKVTNADLKIYRYLRIKIIYRRVRIITAFTF